jgi:hypothetical protein
MDINHDRFITTRSIDFNQDSSVVIHQGLHWICTYLWILVFGPLAIVIIYGISNQEKPIDDFGLVIVLCLMLVCPPIIGMILLFYQRIIIISKSYAVCQSWCLFPIEDWKRNKDEYRGILLRRCRQPKFDICILHSKESKSIRIFESNRYPEILKKWKSLCESLNLSPLEYDEKSIIQLSHDHIDKPLGTILHEIKQQFFNKNTENQSEVEYNKKELTLTIDVGKDSINNQLLSIPIIVFLFLLGIGIYEHFTSPPYISHYVVYYSAAAFIAIASCISYPLFTRTKNIIRIDRENLVHVRTTPQGRDLFKHTIPINRIRMIHTAYEHFADGMIFKNSITIDTCDKTYNLGLHCDREERKRIKLELLEFIKDVAESQR